jgi:hypothetical protein
MDEIPKRSNTGNSFGTKIIQRSRQWHTRQIRNTYPLYFGTVSGTVCGFVGSEIEITRYLAG